MSESNIVKLNRKRALRAYELVFDRVNTMNKEKSDLKETERNEKRLKTLCRNLPVLIQRNGLLTTLTYLNSKEGSEEDKESIEKYLYKGMEEWLFHEVINIEDEKKTDIITYLININEKGMPYIHNENSFLTKEAMEFAIWIKRNAEGIIDNKSISENGNIT